MDVKALIPLLVQGSLILLIVAIGLQSRWEDLAYVFRRPALLIRAVIAVNVVVPLVAILLLLMLPVQPMTKIGLVIMAVSPLAPFAPGKMLKCGADRSYVVGLYVALILLAVLIVPATIALLSALFPADADLPVAVIAKFVLVSVLLPLLGGVIAGSLWPNLARRVAPVLTLVAYLLLAPIILIALYSSGGQILALIGNGAVLAIVLTVVAGLAAGHWLGGAEPGHRLALADAATTRHPGIAGLIAHRHFEDPRVMLAVVLFLLTSIIVSGLYKAWLKKRHPPAQAAPVSPA